MRPPFDRTALPVSTLLLVASLLVLAGACGNESGRGNVPGAAIGTPCVAVADCDFGGATCIDGLPGGYCTIECPAAGCPEGTACALFESGSVCARTCTSDLDCRNGYACSIPDGATLGICDVDFSGPPDAGDDTDSPDAGDTTGEDSGDDATTDTGADTAPVDAADTTPDDATPDTSGDVAPDTEPADTTVPPDTTPDATPDTSVPEVPIGTGCTSNEDCTEGPSPQCVSWLPEGYCSSGCEADAECGAGNICASAGFGPTLCMDGCASDADCRDGYGCCTWAGPACLPSWACF